MIQKLNLASTLAALVCFFLPWIDVQCSGKSMATQTGFQAVIGSTSAGEGAKAMKEATEPMGLKKQKPDDNQRPEKGPEFALLTALGFVALLFATVAAFMALRSGASATGRMVSILCAVSLGVILLQTAAGFPVERTMNESIKERQEQQSAHKPMPGRSSTAENPIAKTGASMAANLIQVKYSPAFYITLLALGIPVLILLNSLLDAAKSRK
jgi:hypothetical protein